MPIAINIRLPNHLIHLLISKFFPQIGHNMSQLSSRNQPISIPIKHFKRFDQFLLRIGIFHFSEITKLGTLP